MASEHDLNQLAGLDDPPEPPHQSPAEARQEFMAFRAMLVKPLTAREKRIRAGRHVIQKLQVGDPVTWGGRQGRVAAVVPYARHPMYLGFPELAGAGYWREHESYVVMVAGKAWWPRVGTLRKSDADESEAGHEQAPTAGTVRDRAAGDAVAGQRQPAPG